MTHSLSLTSPLVCISCLDVTHLPHIQVTVCWAWSPCACGCAHEEKQQWVQQFWESFVNPVICAGFAVSCLSISRLMPVSMLYNLSSWTHREQAILPPALHTPSSQSVSVPRMLLPLISSAHTWDSTMNLSAITNYQHNVSTGCSSCTESQLVPLYILVPHHDLWHSTRHSCCPGHTGLQLWFAGAQVDEPSRPLPDSSHWCSWGTIPVMATNVSQRRTAT